MDCVITNDNRQVYIKLDNNGLPVTCVKSAAQVFPDQKAKNILANLPRTLQKFHFKVVPAYSEMVQTDETIKHNDIKAVLHQVADIKTIKKDDYIVPDKVTNWVQRVESCNSLIVDARNRKKELFNQLSNVEKELNNCLHVIELTKSKNACDGYKEYKKIKNVLEKRRVIKDELSVVQSISTCNTDFSQIGSLVERLKDREFTIREIDDYTI